MRSRIRWRLPSTPSGTGTSLMFRVHKTPSLESRTCIPADGTRRVAPRIPSAPTSKRPRVFLQGSETPILFRNVQEIAKKEALERMTACCRLTKASPPRTSSTDSNNKTLPSSSLSSCKGSGCRRAACRTFQAALRHRKLLKSPRSHLSTSMETGGKSNE
jgi:hypothetical protein